MASALHHQPPPWPHISCHCSPDCWYAGSMRSQVVNALHMPQASMGESCRRRPVSQGKRQCTCSARQQQHGNFVIPEPSLSATDTLLALPEPQMWCVLPLLLL